MKHPPGRDRPASWSRRVDAVGGRPSPGPATTHHRRIASTGGNRCLSAIGEGDRSAHTGESAGPMPVPGGAGSKAPAQSGRSGPARGRTSLRPRLGTATAAGRDHSKGIGVRVRGEPMTPRRSPCRRSSPGAAVDVRSGRSRGRRPADRPRDTRPPSHLGPDPGRAHTRAGRRASGRAGPSESARAPGSAPISTSFDETLGQDVHSQLFSLRTRPPEVKDDSRDAGAGPPRRPRPGRSRPTMPRDSAEAGILGNPPRPTRPLPPRLCYPGGS